MLDGSRLPGTKVEGLEVKSLVTLILHRTAGLLCVLSLFTGLAHGGLVHLDFDAITGGEITSPLYEDGFRISSNCHIDSGDSHWVSFALGLLAPEGTPIQGRAIGSDVSGCHAAGSANPEYLGPYEYSAAGVSNIYFDAGGSSFDFLSFDWIGVGFFTVRSSAGGAMSFNSNSGRSEMARVALSGQEWRGVSWVMFDGFRASNAVNVFDNLVFSVPSADSLDLSIVGLFILGLSRIRGSRFCSTKRFLGLTRSLTTRST